MKFSEVSVGQKFVFDFDKSVKGRKLERNNNGSYYYSYEKVAKNKVKCLSCPKTENCVGDISLFGPSFENTLCHLLEEKIEENKGYKVTSNGMNIGTAFDKETLTSLVRYVLLSCYYTDNPLEQKGLEIEFGGFTTSFSFIEDTVFDVVGYYFD